MGKKQDGDIHDNLSHCTGTEEGMEGSQSSLAFTTTLRLRPCCRVLSALRHVINMDDDKMVTAVMVRGVMLEPFPLRE